jgi:hypothetical protein
LGLDFFEEGAAIFFGVFLKYKDATAFANDFVGFGVDFVAFAFDKRSATAHALSLGK